MQTSIPPQVPIKCGPLNNAKNEIAYKLPHPLHLKVSRAKQTRRKIWRLTVKELPMDQKKFMKFKKNSGKIRWSSRLPGEYTKGLPFLYIYIADNIRVRATIVRMQCVNKKLYMVTTPTIGLRHRGILGKKVSYYDHIKPYKDIVTAKYIIDLEVSKLYRVLYNKNEDNILRKLLKYR